MTRTENARQNLTVNLMNGNTVVRTVTLNAGNNWTAKVTGLCEEG
ncbi:MAG: hypothetical protein ACLUTU_05360 [Blautia faecis]